MVYLNGGNWTSRSEGKKVNRERYHRRKHHGDTSDALVYDEGFDDMLKADDL